MSALNAQSRAFFESRYQSNSDPWDFEGSAYERDRYRATLASLSSSTYRRIYEPGCSIGVLTNALCDRAREVFACDISQTAVESARERCRRHEHVHIERCDIRESAPPSQLDLIVLSEVGYYFTTPELQAIALRLRGSLVPGGELVAVNWLGISADHLLHGDDVVGVLDDCLQCTSIGREVYEGFRIDSWRRCS